MAVTMVVTYHGCYVPWLLRTMAVTMLLRTMAVTYHGCYVPWLLLVANVPSVQFRSAN